MIKRLIAVILLAMALITTIDAHPAAAAASRSVPIGNDETESSDKDFSFDESTGQSAQKESALASTIISIRKKYEGSVEIEMLAKLIYREARGIPGDTEKAAVVWCVLNRVDAPNYPKTIRKVITQKYQFAWVPKTPVLKKFKEIALDVVIRWELEKTGYDDVGRVLPANYLFFAGRGGHNRFRNKYKTSKHWNWSLDSPYDDGGSTLDSVSYALEETI